MLIKRVKYKFERRFLVNKIWVKGKTVKTYLAKQTNVYTLGNSEICFYINKYVFCIARD